MKIKSKFTIWPTLAALALGMFATPVIGQQQDTSLTQAQRAHQIIGKQVMSSDNQKIGTLDEMVVDLESGHILYAVVGASNGKIAVAPGVFTQTTGPSLMVNETKAKLDAAPQFTSTIAQPNQMGQASFVAQVCQYYGQPAWWQGSAPVNQGSFHNVHRLTQLSGTQVKDVNNTPLGKVSTEIVDLPAGRILFVILAPASRLNLDSNLYALPPDALTLASNQKTLVSNLNQQQLASAPHFTNSSWPNFADPAYASQIYQHYGKQAWFQGGASQVQPTGR
ncbi:MAG TPA: PRC-barrel domain-containing protein [Verrucomicrobiae bacterium]|nr:PRC-barrel domain-containing protein [Verrucomicrobiae bacterium]